MRTRRKFLHTSAAVLSGMALSSCGWTLAQVRPTPPGGKGSKDVLYIYTWADYTDDDLLARFKEETGIQVMVGVFDSNEAMLARVQAGGGSAYSVIYPSDYMVRQMVDLKLLAPIDPTRLIGIEDLFPRFQDPSFDPKNRHSVPFSWGTSGLIYNTKKLQPPPDDWSYLWQHQQQLSKQMTLINDVREVLGATLKSLGYSYNSTNPQEVKQAYDKLVQIKPAIASFTTDAWKTQMLSGDLLLSMCYSTDAISAIEENQDLAYVLPKSGSSLYMDTLVIPKTAPNPDGAYEWINFMLRPDIAAGICQRLNFATPNQKGFSKLSPKFSQNPSLYPPESALEKCEGISPIGNFSDVYDRYWTQLTGS